MDKDLPWTVSPIPVTPPRKKKSPRKNPSARRRVLNKEKSDRMAHMESMRPFEVLLKRGHNINGTIYGPGRVTLPGPIARELANREYHADLEEEKFRGTRAGIIGGRTAQGSHKVTMVPTELFENAYEIAQPMDQVSGGGLPDPGTGAKF